MTVSRNIGESNFSLTLTESLNLTTLSRTTLASHAMRLEYKIHDLKFKKARKNDPSHVNKVAINDEKIQREIDTMEETLKMVNQAMTVIAVTNESQPYTVLGIPAHAAVTTSIMTTAFSFYGTLFSIYISNTSQSSTAL